MSKYTYVAGPLTRADVQAMNSEQLHWHEVNNAENLNKAIAPPVVAQPTPPPVPLTPEQKKAQIENDFKAFLDGRIQTQELVDEFLEARELPRIVQRDVKRWLSEHPEYANVEKNRKLMNYWLDLHDYPATYDHLNEAYAALKPTGNLILHKIESPVDPNKPETRVGAWRNGRFIPDPGYNKPAETVYAQHADTPATVGQSDPGGVAAGESTIRKSVNKTADEYLKSINSSRTFQRKMDESKS